MTAQPEHSGVRRLLDELSARPSSGYTPYVTNEDGMPVYVQTPSVGGFGTIRVPWRGSPQSQDESPNA